MNSPVIELRYPIQVQEIILAMPSNKRKQSNKTRSKSKSSLTDIPRQAKHTFTTMSCRMPRVTDCTTVRCQTDGVLTATAASAVTTTFNFTLSSANIGSGFYDRYKIDAIRFSIVPRNNAIGLVSGLSDFYFAIDYDDSNSFVSSAQAIQNATCIVLAPGESATRTFAPRIAVATYNGAFAGYANQKSQWLDAASTTVQHYGVKIYVPATGVVGQTVFQQWHYTVEYFISFLNSIG
jgi:hypothetical protein